MADKYYMEARWQPSVPLDGVFYIPSGYYTIGEEIDTANCKFISRQELLQLIPYLDNSGYLQPKLDTKLRDEDLKITHRLLDLLDKSIGGGDPYASK